MLREVANKLFQEYWSANDVIAEAVYDKLEELGVDLDDNLSEVISLKIDDFLRESDHKDDFDNDLKTLAENISKDIDASKYDYQQFSLSTQDIEQVLERIFTSLKEFVVKKSAENLSEAWKKDSHRLLEIRRKDANYFQSLLDSVWRKPLFLLEMLIDISRDLVTKFLEEIAENPKDEISHIALQQLTLRGLQVADEIYLLLKNGYADGAEARWRTLSEIMVVTVFIGEHGPETAKRYLAHSVITNHKEIRELINTYSPEEWDEDEYKYYLDELKKLEKLKTIMIEEYGNSFKNDFGWAAHIVENPSIRTLEKAIGLHQNRPRYMSANRNVHSGSESIQERLGNNPFSDSIATGQSTFGIAEPGRQTAFALCRLVSVLILKRPSLDHQAELKALLKLRNEIYEEFEKVHEEQLQAEIDNIENNNADDPDFEGS